MPSPPQATANLRWRMRLRGAVQGVGFRPFVYQLANDLGLSGFVANDPGGVTIEIEGTQPVLAEFERRLHHEKPPASTPELVARTTIPANGEPSFVIHASSVVGAPTAVLLPDLAICADCARELGDPGDRRFGYPFTNCTRCGPRFSIIERLPYDRPHTTMRGFVMCARCAAEYADPHDRRFHAQPNACPDCGPSILLTDAAGSSLAQGAAALETAAAVVRGGGVLALHGLGGFHLIVDATNATAVAALRRRKGRWEKPLAVMVPSLDAAETLCEVDAAARTLLESPESPIVLLPRRAGAAVADEVAPQNPFLGVMLPYTPLHRLLLAKLGRVVVATSGNTSEEPICTTPDEARARLGHIADRFLLHDRPIARQVDDSVAAVVAGGPQLLRRSRGFSPRPLRLAAAGPTVLAVGPHLKNSITLVVGDEAFVSQHVGDLENAIAADAHARIVRDFLDLYAASPAAVAHDLHPDHASTVWLGAMREAGAAPDAPEWQAKLFAARPVAVQHHHAHLAACLAEHRHEGPALGVTWDGTGLGPDGSIWGGEFLLGDARGCRRVVHLRAFRLPGGDAAAREPRRSAYAVLHAAHLLERAAAGGAAPLAAFPPAERAVLDRMLERSVSSPLTTSAGRLFDAVAALAGLRPRVRFEGQAAMELEYAARRARGTASPYPCPLVTSPREEPAILDWAPMIQAVLHDVERGTDVSTVAARFHAGLADAIVAAARHVACPTIVLTGGCFQNRLLTEQSHTLLTQAGFRVLVHRQVPPNDGGVSLGQAVIAAAELAAR
ncbi:MAG: carbamoyltransferase HypF [Polyangiaceae bacterium]|nr:carbamoyltransferase HypF [Polyangiaceae bacterium]